MSFSNPAHRIPRSQIAGHEGHWVKVFDPPEANPDTPELLAPTNPVPAFVAATVPDAKMSRTNTVQVRLRHRTPIVMNDGKEIEFFTISNPDVDAAMDIFPGPTIRVPRGVIFHGETASSGGPHTIHWHGLEPTPMNDGVGHCSMELGSYIYQFQPNFIGTYFYHCHRNTVQHFEFGLYGLFLVEPPDAFDQRNPALPFYAGGYPRRTAANLIRYPQYPGFNSNPVVSGDPHAMTVPYDVEAVWVLDDRDSRWSDLASDHAAFYPAHRDRPGVDDEFYHGFFHDHNPDYFFVTGQQIPGDLGSTTASIAPNLTIPAALNSGVNGMQISVNAQRNQTILVRVLNGAYADAIVRFPVDVTVIAFDGRALGVPPFARYNHPFTLRANTPYRLSTARRFDCLIRSSTAIDTFATVEYRSTLGNRHLLTGRIPIRIS